MATPFGMSVTAAQFYSDASTVLRIDGNNREAAKGMLQIHMLVMSLHYTGIEIKSAHSLESWNGGVLVMVSGSVHIKGLSSGRKFIQSFFLAPQEKGYFVLNDIFHFIDEESVHHLPIAYLDQGNLDSEVIASATNQEPAFNYMLGGETLRELVAPVDNEENGPVGNYNFSEGRLEHTSDADRIFEDNFEQSTGSLQNSTSHVHDHLSAHVEESVREPQKQTYASIVAKGPSAATAPPQMSSSKGTSSELEWSHVPEPPIQQSIASSVGADRWGDDAAEEDLALADEGEIKSVYVRSFPSTVSASEIEEEFKKFGKLKLDAVAIRNRKDGFCYAFVEFEDVTGVQNAVKASTVEIAGCQVFIEARRANRVNAFQGGRPGRARGWSGYPTGAPRGYFGGRGSGRGRAHDGSSRGYRRPTQRGIYRPVSGQGRGRSSEPSA
ncbi:nuclear transport factor 2-like isoform X2 [Diospyros lotus]|uniref:nuclear transport factor 2-like isoform X2 n=1 Tax=Diospyros lotus TaxID=55363 RepID=UPI00225B9403|nr:nuclear transport factor 2-like isoform X2 [Diospyros lotus]